METSGSGPGFSTGVVLGDLDGDGILEMISAGYAFDSGVGDYQGQASVLTGDTREGIAPILEFSLRTKADDLQALAPLERKLESLSTQRGSLEAFQSRLSSALRALSSTTENYEAARARITDVDVEEESVNLNRQTIMQQASSAVLVQANLQPSLALRLLG